MTTSDNDLKAIHVLKARYFRYMDTKQWALWRGLFTDDMVFYMEDAVMPTTNEPITTSGDDFVEYVSDLLTTAVTVHHGHMPEIEIFSDHHARGIWAMFDHVDDHTKGFAIKGAGHYHENYTKGSDGAWRIAELRLTRIRVDVVPTSQPEIARPWPPAWKRT